MAGGAAAFPIANCAWRDGEVLALSSQHLPAVIRNAQRVRLLIRGRWHDAVPTAISDQEAQAEPR